jgi:hypothetical protein
MPDTPKAELVSFVKGFDEDFARYIAEKARLFFATELIAYHKQKTEARTSRG